MAPQTLFSWTRYWLPFVELASLPVSGVVPRGIDRKSRGLILLNDVVERPLAFLLGDPGVGKSIELRSEFNRRKSADKQATLFVDGRLVSTVQELQSEWFSTEAWASWRNGSHSLWVCFDGFDQSNSNVKRLGERILRQLNDCPIERLTITLASRTVEWDRSFGESLRKLFGEARVTASSADELTFALAPLSYDDISEAASQAGLEGEQFADALLAQKLGPLAGRPLGLRWLIKIYRISGMIPNNLVDVFWDGMRMVAQEPDEDMPRSPITPEIMREIACRVAFITLFGDKPNVWTGNDYGSDTTGCVKLEELVGGNEAFQFEQASVDTTTLDLVLRTGLFQGVGMNKIGWSHHSYQEFLAAKYAITHELSTNQLLELLTNPSDDQARVIPHLRSTAAWLASMSSEIFNYLLGHDLETLLESDTALSQSEDRQRLLDAVLNSAGAEDEFETRHRRRGDFAKLKFDSIDESLRSIIYDKTQPIEKRLVAIQIARDCEVYDLINDLVSICIDAKEHERIRKHAAYVLRDLGSPSACLEINALVSRDLLTDQGLSPLAVDEIRGCAFACEARVRRLSEASWSQLSEPASDVYGAYKTFLSRYLVELNGENVLCALRWLESQQKWSGDYEYEFENAETDILISAWHNLDDPRVATAYAHYYLDKANDLRSVFGKRRNSLGVHRNDENVASLVSEAEHRHALLIAIVETLSEARTSEDRTVSKVKQYSSLIVPSDFYWLVEKTGVEPIDLKQEVWMEFALWAMDVTKTEQTEAIWRLKEQGLAPKLMSAAFDPIELGSEKARQFKRNWEIFYAPPEYTHDRGLIEEFHARVADALGHSKPEGHSSWWRLQFLLNFDGRHEKLFSHPLHDAVNPAERPAWQFLDLGEQERAFEAAFWFVQHHEPDSNWQGTNRFELIDLAGMSGFTGLLLHQELLLAQIDNEVWERWGKVFLFFPTLTSESEMPVRDRLLKRSVRAGFDIGEYVGRVASRVTSESTLSLRTAFKAAYQVLERSDWETIVRHFLDPNCGAVVNWVAIDSLQLLESVEDGTWAKSWELAGIWLGDPLHQTDAARLGARMLAEMGSKNLSAEVWRTIFGNDSLREQFVKHLLYEDRPQHRTLAGLPGSDLAELFKYMEVTYPSSQDPSFESGMHTVTSRESIATYRDSIPTTLANRSTWEAVGMLRRLAEAFPDNRQVGFALEQARENARVASRPTPRVEDLLQIALSPSKRLVDSPQALQNAISESLGRLQLALKGSPPKAAGWWNYPWEKDQRALNRGEVPAPKEENEISDEIVIHLRKDLESRVVAHREIEDRRLNIVDIVIDAVIPNNLSPNDTITVPCEVKGCWNRDLFTSMETQLHDRYLNENGFSHGLYIVVFFDCNRWWKPNYRRRHKNQKRHSLESIREQLEQQSIALSKNGKSIHLILLDATL